MQSVLALSFQCLIKWRIKLLNGEQRDILNPEEKLKMFSSSPADSGLKVDYGFYGSKSISYVNNLCISFNLRERVRKDCTQFSAVPEWLRRPIADMWLWHGEEAHRPFHQTLNKPWEKHFYYALFSGCILNMEKWIIHQLRGPVSVVNSVGVSPLSVVEVIFSPGVTVGGWIRGYYSTITVSFGHQFHFHRSTFPYISNVLNINCNWLICLLSHLHCCLSQRESVSSPPHLQTLF